MKYRRVKILEEMVRDVCSPQDLKEIDDLYIRNEKGLAIIKMLRIIKPHWDRFIAQSNKDKSFEERFKNDIKINYGTI